MPDIATLRLWLSEAETARHKIVTGKQTISVRYEGKGEVRYNEGNLDALDSYIASLRSQLSCADATPAERRRPINFTF